LLISSLNAGYCFCLCKRESAPNGPKSFRPPSTFFFQIAHLKTKGERTVKTMHSPFRPNIQLCVALPGETSKQATELISAYHLVVGTTG
jgi:hypothetical protein